MAWPWPWWKKLTLLLHHFYKPDFLQFSSTRFGCQADTSWDISLWNISVASTLGREEEEHNWKLWIFVQIDTKTNRRQCDGIIYSFSPPWRPLGPAWGLSVKGWRVTMESWPQHRRPCVKSTLPNVISESSLCNGTSKDRSAGETIETFCWTYGIIWRQQSQLCRFKYWNLKKPPGVGNLWLTLISI